MKLYRIDGPTPQGPAGQQEQAYLLAVEFHEAALRAGATEHDQDGVPLSALVPMIVGYAFACELYLKALGPGGKGVKSHLLRALFLRLPWDLKARVEAAYLERTGRDERELLGDVTGFSDAFREWRYVYEGDGRQVHTNLLIAFTQGLYEVVRAAFPDWKSNALQDGRFRALEPRGSMTVKNLGGGVFLEAVDGTEGRQLSTPEAR